MPLKMNKRIIGIKVEIDKTMNKNQILDFLIERRKKNETALIPDILTIDVLIEELEEELDDHDCHLSPNDGCDHPSHKQI